MKNTTKKTAVNTATQPTTTPAALAPVQVNTAEIITAENVQTMGECIAVRALKTCYQKGGQPFIYSLYCGLVADITENKKTGAPLSDGYDIAQTASAFLCEHIGKTLQDTTTDGQTDKDGNPVTILRACFRAVNRYIKGERQHEYRRLYVDEIDENGNALYYEIPEFWDMPTAADFKQVTAIIKALNLTSRQAQILRYRLSGKSIHQIADILKIHRKTLQEHMQALQRKYTAYKQAQTANA